MASDERFPGAPCPYPIPDEFKQLGFTGQFWTTAKLDGWDTVPEMREIWEQQAAKAPYLGLNRGWMVAGIDLEAGRAVLVRNDMSAVMDTLNPDLRRHDG